MHTTTIQHIDRHHEMARMKERLGARLLDQALQTAAEQGSINSLMRTFCGPLKCLPEEEQAESTEDLKKLFGAQLRAFHDAKEEERLDLLAEEQQNGADASQSDEQTW